MIAIERCACGGGGNPLGSFVICSGAFLADPVLLGSMGPQEALRSNGMSRTSVSRSLQWLQMSNSHGGWESPGDCSLMTCGGAFLADLILLGSMGASGSSSDQTA